MVSAPAWRARVPVFVDRGISIRRASALLSVPRSTLGYVATQPAKDALVIERMKHYAAMYPRFGYRRIHVYLERAGIQLGWDRMLPALATGWTAGSEEAAAQARCRLPPPAVAGQGPESGVGL